MEAKLEDNAEKLLLQQKDALGLSEGSRRKLYHHIKYQQRVL